MLGRISANRRVVILLLDSWVIFLHIRLEVIRKSAIHARPVVRDLEAGAQYAV